MKKPFFILGELDEIRKVFVYESKQNTPSTKEKGRPIEFQPNLIVQKEASTGKKLVLIELSDYAKIFGIHVNDFFLDVFLDIFISYEQNTGRFPIQYIDVSE